MIYQKFANILQEITSVEASCAEAMVALGYEPWQQEEEEEEPRGVENATAATATSTTKAET